MLDKKLGSISPRCTSESQVYINSEKDVDLVTRVGNHTVKMGSLEGYENKLNKLYAFYKNALPLEGWNKYSVINLKYGNQVICKK